jgi:hypothetical protein
MRYFKFALVAGMLPLSTAVGAQTTSPQLPPQNPWSKTINLDINPLIGRGISQQDNNDIVDDSSVDASIRFSRSISPEADFRLRAGVILTPNIYDSDAVSSGLYAQVSVGERAFANGDPRSLREYATAFPDKTKPYLRYRISRAYDGFVNDGTRFDHRITAGINHRDVRGVMCPRSEPDGSYNGPCTSEGMFFEYDVVLNTQWSTESERNRIYPSAKFTVTSRPIFGDLRVFGSIFGETSFFSNSRVDSGSLREDRLLQFNAGLDLSAPFQSWLGLSSGAFSISGQWAKQWSNDADRRFTRAIFAPSLAVDFAF